MNLKPMPLAIACKSRLLTLTTLISLVLPGVAAMAAANTDNTTADASSPTSAADKGFSYFLGLARQELRYSETGSRYPFKTTASAGSPLLVTGALYAVNDQWLLSLDNETTFYAGRGNETWRATSATFAGQPLTSPVLQTNRFSLSQSHTQLLGHYRVKDQWFVLAGGALRTQSFKRFAFVAGPDDATRLSTNSTVEESASEILFKLGAALESEQVRGQAAHYGLRATLGLPLWRRLTNTESPTLQFDAAKGYDLSLEGRYSWALSRNIHLGSWGQWAVAHRGNQILGAAEMPKSRLDSLSYGLELLWKL